MIRSLWIAKTGLDAQQTQMDVISHNLANVSTNGYKRSQAVFEDLIYQNMRQVGANSSSDTQLPTGLQLGTGVRPVATSRLFTQGNLQQTSNSFDMAISGHGFFQLQMPDGTTGYTRDGSFHPDAQGQLVNANGIPLSPPISVPQGTRDITIANDGTVTVSIAGQDGVTQIGQIQLATFQNAAGLDPQGQNVFKETDASGAPTASTPGMNGAGMIQQGYLETSNVNVVEELVSMIQTQRAYEINSKAIQTSDQMLARISQL
ncbi:flagellar basal-body rod protein FlgG [Lautropia dentalis]|jgi:flagellar basal-body rod protein flgG|uniref:Flagellar basal-body rod protein FlgG n=1 Tax=Lautropia dentalis TaxID=2490857 RepID=A0A3R8NSZ6_9BURK|nr:flagellar basal-body rod protein FlgG [Lautropia dentalis]RRN45175.1 flagellar basal-body rod protein FlgG [Lautropia dentalis]